MLKGYLIIWTVDNKVSLNIGNMAKSRKLFRWFREHIFSLHKENGLKNIEVTEVTELARLSVAIPGGCGRKMTLSGGQKPSSDWNVFHY